MDIVKIVPNSSNLFIYFFSEQTLRSSDKHWNSKLPYLQNPLLCQRAWWNSWEWLFCFHWKSLQCRTLQNTCLSVWNTRSCKYWKGRCLQMKLHLHPCVTEMMIVFSVVIYKPNEILCYWFIVPAWWPEIWIKVWLARTLLLLRASEETNWPLFKWVKSASCF